MTDVVKMVSVLKRTGINGFVGIDNIVNNIDVISNVNKISHNMDEAVPFVTSGPANIDWGFREKFKLPYNNCLFIYVPDDDEFSVMAVHATVEGEDEIHIRMLLQNRNGTWKGFTSGLIMRGRDYRGELAGTAHAYTFVGVVGYFLDILEKNSDVDMHDAALFSIQESRINKGKPFLPEIRVIKPHNGTNADTTGTGSAKSPHHRRGHWKTYKKTGKRVWYPPCEINGGSDTAPPVHVVEG